MEIKNITTGFTEEGAAKVKEMAKRYGLLKHMMLDAMIESVDEQSPSFKERIKYWQDVRGVKSNVSDKVAMAISRASGTLSEDEIIRLLEMAEAQNNSE